MNIGFSPPFQKIRGKNSEKNRKKKSQSYGDSLRELPSGCGRCCINNYSNLKGWRFQLGLLIHPIAY